MLGNAGYALLPLFIQWGKQYNYVKPQPWGNVICLMQVERRHARVRGPHLAGGGGLGSYVDSEWG